MIQAWIAFVCAGFVGTGLCAALAARLGLVDRSESAPERKLQKSPVPRVGGLVLAGVLFAVASWTHKGNVPAPLSAGAAFLVGLLDDLAPRGLPRALKFSLEALVCAAFAWEVPGSLAGSFALAALALAAANTFDNADGALASLGCLGLGAAGSMGAGLLAGFLPWNLWLRDAHGSPKAYLGDAGSHFLAIALAGDPRSAPFLVLPALDLARLSWVRWRAGSRPWIGDRRHLAHRLQARGLRPTAVALLLAMIASPALFLAPLWAAVATAVLFALALAVAPDPCPDPGAAG